MNLDLLIKFLSSCATKIIDRREPKPEKVREDYLFTKRFLADMKGKDIHPFLREKGYQAITGSKGISADDAEYLIELEDAPKKIKDFALGRQYLEIDPNPIQSAINFREKYRERKSRTWRKLIYLALYFLSGMIAFSPLIFVRTFGGPIPALIFFVAFALPFGSLAYLFLQSGVRIYRAEHLVSNQALSPYRIARISH